MLIIPSVIVVAGIREHQRVSIDRGNSGGRVRNKRGPLVDHVATFVPAEVKRHWQVSIRVEKVNRRHRLELVHARNFARHLQ